MIGMVDSYNVSVAFSLILMEAYRQRQKAGLYNRQRLPDAEVERLAFEWGYPKLKNMYQARGIPYPQLDEDGYILDP